MSFSDGISPATSTGIPYMYFTDMEMSVHDLKCKNQMTLSMTLAQGDYCSRQNLGTQSNQFHVGKSVIWFHVKNPSFQILKIHLVQD